ncbi:putative DNA-binding protein [Ruegeria sp. P4]|nr:putative DNA-binding protein [Ruegeria sp. P4]
MSREEQFTRAILDAREPVPEGLLDGIAQPAGRRFSVYRNNVAVSLTEALHQGFPVIAKLLGQQNMDGLAAMYLRAHPPSSPLMMHYGAGFPEFLENLEQLSHLGYLGDVARLELALRRSYHAGDAAPLDPARLGAMAPQDLMRCRLHFAPAMGLMRSDWPIFSIWRYNTEPNAPKPQAGAEDLLITRPDFDPIPQLLPKGSAVWIAALQAGETLGDATDAATNEFPAFDLSAPLALLIEGLALTDLSQ